MAQISGIEQELGKKGEYGILALMPRRAKFLRDPTHTVVFHSTPNHSSWLNQIEIWLSILVRKVLKRGSFASVEALEAKVLAFISRAPTPLRVYAPCGESISARRSSLEESSATLLPATLHLVDAKRDLSG